MRCFGSHVTDHVRGGTGLSFATAGDRHSSKRESDASKRCEGIVYLLKVGIQPNTFHQIIGRYNPHVRSQMITLILAVLAFTPLQVTLSDSKADRVVVLKKERTLLLMRQGQVVKSYKIALGGEPVGPKERQGDHKTPEGVYVLDRRNAKSKFYRSIHVSYPDAKDRAHAANVGADPGGDIMVHGLPNGFGWLGSAHRAKDWTDGCIAVTNDEMDEIWHAVDEGTRIEIKP